MKPSLNHTDNSKTFRSLTDLSKAELTNERSLDQANWQVKLRGGRETQGGIKLAPEETQSHSGHKNEARKQQINR